MSENTQPITDITSNPNEVSKETKKQKRGPGLRSLLYGLGTKK